MARLNGLKIISIKENGNAFEYLGVEIIRSMSNIRKIFKAPYVLFAVGFVSVLKIMSKTNLKSHKYLHSGYHVLMQKK
jgi:hypothetical protein